jgi:cellulose synthase/poly-beta-1,6-N-acetylglucosamine synthase-like glycosyltransferase
MMIVIVVSLAILAYTYAGYPVLVAVLARLFGRRRADAADAAGEWTPMVSAMIPVANAKAYLDRKVESLRAQEWPAEKIEILLYCDGPTDGTTELARAWADKDPRVKVIEGKTRAGKPTALNAMREIARGDVLLMTDVRQELSTNAVRSLVSTLAPPRVGCAAGNLVMRGGHGAGAYWKYEKFIRKQEAALRGMVGVSGALYAIRREDLGVLPADLILDDMWIPMRLRLRGRTIVFCEDAHAYDETFDDDREFARKVRTLAGNYQLFARMPRLLVPVANPSWFETVSHKVMRLLCPWAMIVLAGSSAIAAADGSRFAQVIVVGQAMFYLLAAIKLTKIGALARTFVVLNAAAVVGLWRWATGGQSIRW